MYAQGAGPIDKIRFDKISVTEHKIQLNVYDALHNMIVYLNE